MNCPTCGHADAEVKEDKNANAFLFCPDCATQVFTRNQHRDFQMRKNMRPVTVTVTEPKPAAQPATTLPAVEPGIGYGQQPAPVKAPPAPVKPKSAGWFQPLMGQP